MPSNSKLFVKPFIGGINTELSSVEDAILYTADELNCTILPEGIRGRRLGFNIERDGKWIEGAAKDATSLYYWDNVGKRNFDYVVVQRDTILHFFINSETELSTQKIDKTIDISPYIVNDSYDRVLKYASVAGDLLIVGEWIDPLKVSWDFDNNSFNIKRVNIKWRDLIGIDDGLEVDTMPAELTPEHQYNLYNQGWDKQVYDANNSNTHAVEKFKDEIGLYPSNNMLHYLDKRGDTISDYDAFEIMKHFYGNTPAPKGHYILDYFTRSRTRVSGISVENDSINEEFKNVVIMRQSKLESDTYLKELIGATQGAMYRALNPEALPVYIDTSVKVNSFRIDIYDACKQNGDLIDNTAYDMYKRNFENVNQNLGYRLWYHGPVQLQLYGVNENGENILIKTEEYILPVEGRIGDLAISDVWSFDESLDYSKYFLKINCLNFEDSEWAIAGYWRVDIKVFSTSGEGQLKSNDLIKGRIKDVVCFSGRYFYLVDDTVLFSQVLTETGQGYDKCYQEADPTSEEINDVVDTDGGYVKFPAMGYGKALKSFNRGVLVFGDSSVYGLISPAEQIFTATSYDIVELSRAGLSGPESIVSTSDKVFYWSPLGIFQIGISEQTGRTVVSQSITISTIQELYNNIPNFSKEHCKGVYDYVNNRIYWYYPTDENHIEKLSGCLVLDLTYNSFMQFKIGEPSTDLPYIVSAYNTPNSFEIKPTMYVRVNGEKVVANSLPVIAAEERQDNFKRWTAIKHLIEDSNNMFSFGDYNSREFKDFDDHVYNSYMVSRPIMFAGFSAFGNAIQDTSADKQVPILQTLFKRTEQGGLLPYKDPEKIINNGEITVSQFRTYNDVSITDLSHPIKSVKSVIDVTDISKTIQYIQVIIHGNNGDNTNVRIAEGYVPYPTDKILTIPLKILTTEEFSHYNISVEVFHGESDVTGAENFTATHFVTLNTGKEPFSSKYIAESGANIRMRWGWSLNDRSNRWDMVQNGYRPQKDFIHDEYVESRIHVRGRGKAFQVEIRNDDNKDFRLAGMNLVVRSR